MLGQPHRWALERALAVASDIAIEALDHRFDLRRAGPSVQQGTPFHGKDHVAQAGWNPLRMLGVVGEAAGGVAEGERVLHGGPHSCRHATREQLDQRDCLAGIFHASRLTSAGPRLFISGMVS